MRSAIILFVCLFFLINERGTNRALSSNLVFYLKDIWALILWPNTTLAQAQVFCWFGTPEPFLFVCFLFFILSLLHQAQYWNAGGRQVAPATSSTSLTKRRLKHSPSDRNMQMTKPALARASAQAYTVSSKHRTHSAALTPALLQHRTEKGLPPEHLQSISCSTAHSQGLKFGLAEVKGPLSHRLHQGWLSNPHVQGLLQSCLLQWHLPGAKTKYSGSPTLHH